jgi:hypothetical protein
MANKSNKLGGAAAHTLCLAPQTDRCAASIIKGLDMELIDKKQFVAYLEGYLRIAKWNRGTREEKKQPHDYDGKIAAIIEILSSVKSNSFSNDGPYWEQQIERRDRLIGKKKNKSKFAVSKMETF